MEKKILVSGLVNLETTLNIGTFPVEYTPIHFKTFGVKSNVSGVGYNIAKALHILGDNVKLLSLIGKDSVGNLIKQTIEKDGIVTRYLESQLDENPQSVILYDLNGKRQANTDLKDIQEKIYSEDLFNEVINECSIAALCNINFSRPMLFKAKKLGKVIATDVHVISNIEDEYNKDFMSSANILFMSDENLTCSPEAFAKKVFDAYGNEIIVIGLGAKGALMYVNKDNFLERLPCIKTRKVVNTVGAGDALFSSFIHFYNKLNNPYEAIQKAMYFASYKVGENGAARGFLNERELDNLIYS